MYAELPGDSFGPTATSEGGCEPFWSIPSQWRGIPRLAGRTSGLDTAQLHSANALCTGQGAPGVGQTLVLAMCVRAELGWGGRGSGVRVGSKPRAHWELSLSPPRVLTCSERVTESVWAAFLFLSASTLTTSRSSLLVSKIL
jgi:hypothetical protein